MTDEELRSEIVSLQRGLGDAVQRWSEGQSVKYDGQRRCVALLASAVRLDGALEGMLSVLKTTSVLKTPR